MDLQVEVSEAVALFNQTLDYAYPGIMIVGELANFRVSRNKWVYFDLKDEYATLRFFGTVYALPGPLEDGMKLAVHGRPHIHELYGFSVNVSSITPVGEGTMRKAAQLLAQKLEAEGLFDPARKRSIPYPPQKIGLITSMQSAAYADFIKVLAARYGGLEISVCDVQVQGEQAVPDIISAIKLFNESGEPPEVLVLTRGGGSPEDLAAFSHEQVVRAVAASRIPTLVAIGHEIDLSLSELAADARASTPSNAAELLVPDKKDLASQLLAKQSWLERGLLDVLAASRQQLAHAEGFMLQRLQQTLRSSQTTLTAQEQLLQALSPQAALQRGYALIYQGDHHIHSAKQLPAHADITLRFADGTKRARVQ